MEHGLISNILLCLGLIEQTSIANILGRTYQITVPWNTRVDLPSDPFCDFPNLKLPSADHVFKRTKATIEGEYGAFFGIVLKSTSLPDGYGVFVAGAWVHCGQVKNGVYQDGRKVSVNENERLLKLTNQKCLSDGSVL